MRSVKKICTATLPLLLLCVIVSAGCVGGSSTAVTTPGGGTDTTAPVISNPLPTGQQPAGTASVNMQVTTNENATCRYSTSSTAAYSGMTNFSTTGHTAHSTTISGLTDGQTYNRYVRCSDASGNVNTSSTTVSWSVAASGSGTATLTWGASPVDANHGAPDGYGIYHSTVAGGPYASFAQVGTVLTYTATNLSFGTHCFAVTAFNSGGESAHAACSSGNCCKTIP